MSDTALLFEPLEGADPARPGDPFARLRYQYGQLLGAEDFSAEQRYFVLRERLLNAVLHGTGTVWGLRVTAREDATTNAVQLVCAPGLAIDALGRLIHVEQEVCLDVTGLALAPFWVDLTAPPGAAAEARTRRAYIVLSYRACLDGQVPAIAPPCSDSGDALAYSRVLDRWRLCLAAEPPPDPHPLARDWTRFAATFAAPNDLGATLLDFILTPPAALARLWSNGDDAGLLLATIDLDPVGEPAERTKLATVPDNAVRALLPDVQTVASIATGLRLAGAPADAGFRLLGVTAASDAGRIVLTARFTATPEAISQTADNIRVFRFDSATGWADVTVVGWAVLGPETLITLGEDWTAETTWQLLLTGAGPKPLMDAAARPLAGMAGDAAPAPAQGRDVALVSHFTP